MSRPPLSCDEVDATDARLLELTRRCDALQRGNLELERAVERLQRQNEELVRENQETERRSVHLARQNAEVERARSDLEERAQQLLLSSKYKSEFLANISHELRTPLNSLLILAQMLADNAGGNLDAKQVDYARTIFSAGSELLVLINDILDLSKLESGTVGVDIDELPLDSLRDQLERGFRPVADTRGLAFDIVADPAVPAVLTTDPRRLLQVLKNLLSNAFKFTHHGRVELRVELGRERPEVGEVLKFAVSDTGIGIPPHKQRIIFEAFQQADGTTSRRYGGTGLGLSISRQIARLLGGEIRVQSSPGVGSTFTLLVPRAPEILLGATVGLQAGAPQSPRVPDLAAPDLDDDRGRVQPGERTLLIIDDDLPFARLILEQARENGFKGIIALRGDDGLGLARELRPDAITLDLRLPGLDGWTVLERLKHDAGTRHIPVHLISGTEQDARPRALKQGALAYLSKPVSRAALAGALANVKGFVERSVRDLLLVEDDPSQRDALVELLGDRSVVIHAVASAEEGLRLLGERRFDCAVLDLGLPDMTGFELIRAIRHDDRLRELPIVVYTGKALTADEEDELGRLTEAIILKSARSTDHLLDETALFLHRVGAGPRRTAPAPDRVDPAFAGKKVLIIDADVRNIFAVTSVLERQQMRVLYAEDGRGGLDLLRANPDVDVVLLDVSMPDLDGHAVSREIREDPRFADLPILAVTARAARGDREPCTVAGKSGSISKPVEPERLLSLLRRWL